MGQSESDNIFVSGVSGMARNFYDNKVITFVFPIPMEK